MKIVYTILFFVVMLVLVKMCYLFLTTIDSGHHFWILISLIIGMAGCVALLIYFLSAYINLPADRKHRQF